MKPIIAMLVEIDDDRAAKALNTYVHAIEGAGGLPLIIPYSESEEVIDRYVELCDAFFFTGGRDIDPKYYGEEISAACGEMHHFRDELEFRVFKKAFASGKPILGICRGAQLINVALGGTLYQDIPSELETDMLHRQTEPTMSPSHSVNILPDTPLFDLLGSEKIVANSFHHQAAKRLGDGLEVMAKADDGVIEAFYLKGERYLRAYQWHPERLFDTYTTNRAIFLDFINVAGTQ